jgi:hypothetical protein
MKRFFKALTRARSSTPSPSSSSSRKSSAPLDPYTYDPRKPNPHVSTTPPKSATHPAAHILLPLYIYPLPSAWDPLYTALANHPSTTFSIIVNPGSGPGEGRYPDANYLQCVNRLRNYPNAHLLGYVSTQYAKRDQKLVEKDIAKYADWANHTFEGGAGKEDIHMDGIFFDEAPSAWNGETEKYMREISECVKSSLPASGNYVVFNPGVICDPKFFDLADEVVISENGYAMFGMDILRFVDEKVRDKATVVVHGFSETGRVLREIVEGLCNEGFGGIYITTEPGYTGWGILWEVFAEVVANGGKNGSQ